MLGNKSHQVLQAQPHGLGACWPSLALMTGLLAAAHPAHFTQSLLCSPEAVGSHWEAAIGELAGRVFPSHSDLAAAMLQALSQMYDQWHLDSSPAAGLLAPEDAPASEEAGYDDAGKLPMLSCLGDSEQLYLQACLTAWQAEEYATLTVSTAAQQLRPAPDRLSPVAAVSSEAASLQLRDHRLPAVDAMAGILAQAALLRGDSKHLQQCLRVAGLLLERLPSARLGPIAMGTTDKFTCLADVWHKLILPSWLNNKVDAVR